VVSLTSLSKKTQKILIYIHVYITIKGTAGTVPDPEDKSYYFDKPIALRGQGELREKFAVIAGQTTGATYELAKEVLAKEASGIAGQQDRTSNRHVVFISADGVMEEGRAGLGA
jgi:hypothetical protein